jgi:hypothetical protein
VGILRRHDGRKSKEKDREMNDKWYFIALVRGVYDLRGWVHAMDYGRA